MHWYVDRLERQRPDDQGLLKDTELWFVPVANPDGYQYTFDAERLWRKNLRDNNGDGQIEVGDGVDPNRNYPSTGTTTRRARPTILSSETYRGTGAGVGARDEGAEGAARPGRLRVPGQLTTRPAEWLLYAEGWQIGTPTADDPIYYALAGNLVKPAIARSFHPGLSSDVLYVTNGETTDYAHADARDARVHARAVRGLRRVRLRLPGRRRAGAGGVRAQPDVRARVAKSAEDPENPSPSLGIETKPFYLKSDDPYKEGLPGANFTFDVLLRRPAAGARCWRSAASARSRSSTASTAARERSAPTEWQRRRALRRPADVYYHELRGVVRGTNPGDASRSGSRAAGSGASRSRTRPSRRPATDGARGRRRGLHRRLARRRPRARTTSPTTSTRSTANGVERRRLRRRRPRPQGAGPRSACSATTTPSSGTRATTSSPGAPAGPAATPPARAWTRSSSPRVHERGRPRALHRPARRRAVRGPAPSGTQLYDPKGESPCHAGAPPGVRPAALPAAAARLAATRSTTCSSTGSARYIQVDRATGDDDDGEPFDVIGVDDPFNGLTWGFNGADSADNQDAQRLVRRDERHPAARRVPAVQELAVGRARTGRAGRSRRTRATSTCTRRSPTSRTSGSRATIDVPAGGGDLTFWTSYDTEARLGLPVRGGPTAGGDDWTTLPDANGHTDDRRRATAARRAGATLHPQLDHYQTLEPADVTCTSTGTTGDVERRHRQLRRLAGVDGRPRRLRRRAGRDLDRRTPATGRRRASASSSTTSTLPRRRSDVVRDAASAAGRSPGRRAGQRPEPEQLDPHATPAASRRAPSITHAEDTIYIGLRVRGHPRSRERNEFMRGGTCSLTTLAAW